MQSIVLNICIFFTTFRIILVNQLKLLMKTIAKKLKTIGIVTGSIIGGFMMYLIDEQESIREIWNDQHLLRNLSVCIGSVYMFFRFAMYSAKWPLRLVPFKRRTLSYYIYLAICQFLVGGAILFLFSVALSATILYVLHGISIRDTTYFKNEVYFVLMAAMTLQVVFFMINMMRSLNWPEEPIAMEDAHRDTVYDEDEEYVHLLNEVRFLREGLREYIGLLPAGYIPEVEGVSTERVAYIFSYYKTREMRTLEGEKFSCDSRTVMGWAALLPPEDFFLAGRHLLISRSAIKSVTRLPNYKLELELDPPFEHKRSLSEQATKEFKSWYYSGGGNRTDLPSAV